jgi:hypothetical protein
MREAANLGLATTAELIEELAARARVGGYAEYRTVDIDGESDTSADTLQQAVADVTAK